MEPKLGRNRLHLDLAPSAESTLDAEVERLLALGASRADAGCADGVGMADLVGNEFCVVDVVDPLDPVVLLQGRHAQRQTSSTTDYGPNVT